MVKFNGDDVVQAETSQVYLGFQTLPGFDQESTIVNSQYSERDIR